MSDRLFVGNLSFNTTEDSLRKAFSQYGDVVDVKVVLDRDTGRSRGFAFVSMGSDEAARTAIEQMNGATLDGRQLRVNEAEQRRDGPGGGGGPRGGGGGGFGGPRGGGGGPRGGGGGGPRGDRGGPRGGGGDRGGGRW